MMEPTEGTAMLELLAADRQAGKTTQAVAWVAEGTRVPGYPGWSRVLVIPSARMLDDVRARYWEHLDDFSHRVYSLAEWSHARGCAPNTEVCVEDLDLLVACGALRMPLPGRLVAATMTALPWKDREPPFPVTPDRRVLT